MNTATQTPPASSHYLPPCRRVKVAWLASLTSLRGSAALRGFACAALTSIDNDNRRTLVAALAGIRNNAPTPALRDLAEGARRAVEED